MPTVSKIEEQLVRVESSCKAAKLLYICDFPPSNIAGGPILLRRLLEDYSLDCITVLSGSRYLRVSPIDGRLACPHIAFPTTIGRGRWGLGRIKNLVDWLMIPLLVLETIRLIRKRHADVMMTIAHGNFFIATALAGWVTRTPYVVVMHDDTVTRTVRRPPIPHCFFQPLVRQALGRAAHVYAISSGMQKLLKSAYGVDSELQLPATEINRRDATVGALNPLNSNSSAILFAGTITRSVEGSIRLLAETLVAGKLKLNCILPPQLHLYTKLSDQKIRDWGWVDPSIRVHDWVPQEQLRRVLQSADILFLPFSFSEEVRHAVETAFPSKTADYLASGKPILVFGPSYSTLVRYASEQGFAEVVTEFSADALMHGIQKILLSSAYRERLVARALEVLSQYHDIKRQRNQFRSVLSALAKRNHA